MRATCTADIDLAIVGSGFGGSILAAIARRLGRRVMLLERGRHPRFAIGESASPLAGVLIEQLADLSKRVGLQPRLRDVGIGEEHLAKMASDAMKQTRLLVNNPREVGEADALAIYRAAW